MGMLDEIFHPGAGEARELAEAPHDQILPAPTPGDRLYDEHRRQIQRQECGDPKG